MLVRSATAAVLATAAGILPLSGSPAGAAELPGEVVVPAEQRTDPDADMLVDAGETGYLWGTPGNGYNWTSYADGSTRRLSLPKGQRVEAYATGTDTVGFVDTIKRFVVLRDMKDGSEQVFPLPDGQALEGLFGQVVVTSEVLADRTYRAHLLSWENGRVTDRVVAGLPEGAQLMHGHSRSGGDGMLVFYQQGSDQTHAAWIDRSGQARLSEMRPIARSRSAFSGGRYVQWWPSGRVRVWKTSDFSTPVHDFTLTVPYDQSTAVVGVLGNDLLITRSTPADTSSGAAAKRRIVAVPLGGGPERPVFDGVSGSPVFQPDGTLLVARATEGREGLERSVYAVRPTADGAFTADKVADAPRVQTAIRGLTMAQGRLDTLDQLPWNLSRLRRTDISVSGPLTVGPRLDRGTDGYEFPDANCGAAWCKTFQATGDGRLVYRSSERNSLRVLADGGSLPAAEVPVAREMYQPRKSHASGRYEAVPVAGSANDGYMTHIQVIDLDTGEPVYTSPSHRSVPAYALAGSTLWLEDEDGGPGAVLTVDVRTGTVTTRFRAANCDITELLANTGFLYWACGQTDPGPVTAGGYDLAAKRAVRLPEHREALLGDGYLAWEKDGVLAVTDLRGTAGTRTVGRPALRDAGMGWTVDRFGGPLAYTDQDGDLHLVPSGVRTSDLTAIDQDTPAAARNSAGGWTARWWLSKPAASWQLTLKSTSTGAVVRTFGGGEARGIVKAVWDGKDAAGRALANGSYTWTLTARPADGLGTALSRSGTLVLTGGVPVARDHIGPGGPDGVGDLLGFTPAGTADFRGGTGRGGVDAKVSGSGWTGANIVTAAVPFGDADGDGCNDVLVRLSNGELRRYRPGCGSALAPSTPYTRIGGGWNTFDALTSPGDLTGDGRADLLAREAATGDLYLYESNGAGNFKPRAKTGRGWKNYLLVGAGDLNGDGRADLLARDASGVLWLYPGTGKGTLSGRVKIGGGWQVYNGLVGTGDLNNDGKPDLLARGVDGVLWSYAGDGHGNFGGRMRIGGGWQMYKYLF